MCVREREREKDRLTDRDRETERETDGRMQGDKETEQKGQKIHTFCPPRPPIQPTPQPQGNNYDIVLLQENKQRMNGIGSQELKASSPQFFLFINQRILLALTLESNRHQSDRSAVKSL